MEVLDPEVQPLQPWPRQQRYRPVPVELSPQATAATQVQGSPAERVTANAVATAVVPSPAIPVTSGGIPGWALTGVGIIAVLAALGLIYLTYKKKL